MQELQPQTELIEFTIKQNTEHIIERILKVQPKIVGFGVYIWNTQETLSVVRTLKKLTPQTKIVLGGPEISYETETQELYKYADFVIAGEGDFAFRELCLDILSGKDFSTLNSKIIRPELPAVDQIKLPYYLYSDEDIANRYIYVEASRGCPYKCEYCLSSLDKSVRNFPTDQFLREMQSLIDRGARNFKFIDRTFNLSPSISCGILEFFLQYSHLGIFLHFEMVPDRLPVEIRNLISQFPEGQIQFEIGIQTFNSEVAGLISRRMNWDKLRENFIYLNQHTKVHTHADLIAGLPGEDLESFAKGFDQLIVLKPDEIQVGILKRLKGTPIVRHEKNWEMLYSDEPPFQILSNKNMNFFDILRVQKFAKFWDKIGNSGDFKSTMQLLKNYQEKNSDFEPSFFWLFMRMADYLQEKNPQNSVSLLNLTVSVKEFLLSLELNEELVYATIQEDYSMNGERSLPKVLLSGSVQESNTTALKLGARNKRQQKHSRLTQTL